MAFDTRTQMSDEQKSIMQLRPGNKKLAWGPRREDAQFQVTFVQHQHCGRPLCDLQ